MSLKLRPVSDQVLVITGASSGIGLATARAAVARGARVVLAARTDEALNRVVEELTATGGEAIAIHCDVGDRSEVEQVAAAAIDRYGRIDTWVNNAGVGIWGRIEEVSEADMRRLFETNFWGVVHGSLTALPRLERAGGALINVGSMVSDVAAPLQGIYSASKHAVKGFTNALRMELEERGALISVTLVKPASIGTPMPEHVKAYTDREPRFPPPVYAPEDVAGAILFAAQTPRRDLYVGSAARTAGAVAFAAPRAMDKVGEKVLVKAQLGPNAAVAGDNLYRGNADGRTRGDTHHAVIRPSLYTRAKINPGLTTATAVAAGLGLAAAGGMLRRRRARA